MDQATVGLLTLLVILLGAVPLVVLRPAPLADWPSHLERVWIADHVLHGDPFWSARYEFRSLLIPNAILDAVVLALMRLGLPIAAAGVGFLLLCYGTFMLGFLRLARIGGTPTPLAAALGAMLFFTGDVMFGLLNFITGIGLAFLAASFWFRDDATLSRRFVIAVLATPVILFCHIVAALVFAGMCGCYDLFRPVQGWVRRVLQLAPASLALVMAVLGYKLSATGGDEPRVSYADATSLLGIVRGKVRLAAECLSSGNQVVDVITAVVVVTVLGLLWQRRAGLRFRQSAPVAALAVLPLVAPFSVGEGQFLDARLCVLPLAVGMAILPWARALDRRIQLGLIAACVLRSGVLAVAWASYGPVYDELRASFAGLPPGSTLLTAYSDEPSFYQFRQPPLWNSASLAVDYGLFVPAVFAEPTQHPLVVRPEWRPEWLWSHNANARTPSNLASVRDRARRYCTIDPHAHLFIMHVTAPTLASVENVCDPR